MEVALQAATARYIDRNPNSKQLHESAVNYLPGGNTRTLLHTVPFPISMRSGEGYKLYDEDGHEYVDLVGELTAGLFGHSHARLQEALTTTIREVGLNLGATTALEQRYAGLLCRRFSLERVRFTNSGTEANLHCLAAVKRFTGRRRIVVFRGGYHGGVLSFPTGIAPNNVDQDDWIVVQYNDTEGLKRAFEEYRGLIAAVLVEGIQGSAGFIKAKPQFLAAARQLSTANGAILILDEVMTSRLAAGGLKSRLDVQPDMITLGKYLGGGMPFGAFGGRADIMSVYDPRSAGSLAHSGTFQNNTLMLTAGYVGLSEVYTPDVVEELNTRGNTTLVRLNKLLEHTRLCVTGEGSLMCVHATRTGLNPQDISCKDDILAVEDYELKQLLWLEMLEAGLWLHPRGSIALSMVMPDDVVESFVSAVSNFTKRHLEGGLLIPTKE